MCRSSRPAPPPPPPPQPVPTVAAISEQIPELDLAIESDSDKALKKKKAKKTGKKSLRSDISMTGTSDLNIPN
jgi:hypothetical protein